MSYIVMIITWFSVRYPAIVLRSIVLTYTVPLLYSCTKSLWNVCTVLKTLICCKLHYPMLVAIFDRYHSLFSPIYNKTIWSAAGTVTEITKSSQYYVPLGLCPAGTCLHDHFAQYITVQRAMKNALSCGISNWLSSA